MKHFVLLISKKCRQHNFKNLHPFLVKIKRNSSDLQISFATILFVNYYITEIKRVNHVTSKIRRRHELWNYIARLNIYSTQEIQTVRELPRNWGRRIPCALLWTLWCRSSTRSSQPWETALIDRSRNPIVYCFIFFTNAAKAARCFYGKVSCSCREWFIY